MTPEAIESAYARWAPIYDRTFGAVTHAGRRRATDYINARGGKVLEVGVGTGLALPFYDAALSVIGVDFSAEMLDKAQRRIDRLGLNNIALRRMDGRALDFPDNHFDTVAAMHIVSVVPDPEKVVAEMARVCKPGGDVVIVNHFAREKGALAWLERIVAPLDNVLGWHSDFGMDRVLGEQALDLHREERFPPLGMMTFLVLRKRSVRQLDPAMA
jgi:phosphatidylethanolamine/phosphatidyl-N-methylethanolamine N-methyltransferase